MPGMNLTRDEARRRAELLSVDSYDVHLDLTRGDTTFGSTTTVRFSCREPGSSTFLDLVAPRVHRVVLNGTSLEAATVADGVRVELSGLQADNELVVVADCAYMHTGEGLHRFVDPVDQTVYLYSQFEVADARRVFACFDQPDLKATFTFTVTAPAHWEVVSNQPTPTPEPVAGGAARWGFASTPRISTYITAIVAGDYDVVRDEVATREGSLPLALFTRKSLSQYLDADELFTVTKQGFGFFEELFDRAYPFAKYDQLFVPEFNAGAMENAGAVTIRDEYVFRAKVTDAARERVAETVLHELAHMWFGDLVTMTWWDDLWLNESFATFASVLCQSEVTRWPHSWTTFTNAEKTWAYRQDQLPSTHPISADIRDLEDVEVNFDGITYAKGASVLKQLVAWVGRDEFFAALRRYFERYAWGNTELADLLALLEETSGRDLSEWTQQWLQTAGVNTLRPQVETDVEGTITSFAVLQEAPAAWPTLRSHRLAVGLYDDVDGSLVRRDRVELDVTGARTEVPQLVGLRRPAVVLVNDDDLAYAKIRLDEASLASVVGGIGRFADSLPRTLCWTAAWDMARDAEMAARDYLSLVLAGIGTETDINAVQLLLRQATSAVELFSDPEAVVEARGRLAAGTEEHMRSAAPGSDHQLAFTRAFASAAVTDAQLDVLRGLLAGDVVLDGLEVDVELRWHLLQCLVAAGRARDGEIAGELDRDSTAAGQRHAATSRALRPTPEAKEEVWSAVVERDELPNAVLVATIGGFAHPRQRALARPYVERYFAALNDIWATRTNETAQTLVLGLYPGLLIEQATVESTDAWLDANPDATPALRRVITESKDGVVRALRAQAKDQTAG